jgi:glucose-1-phosphate thymidylyltransferase
MLSGIREILIITSKSERANFISLLGDGSDLGVDFSYLTQDVPRGISDAFIIGEEFIGEKPITLILGDNLFYGSGIINMLVSAKNLTGASIFSYPVSNPQDYGVLTLDSDGLPVEIVEKPTKPISNLAVTGLYVFDGNVSTVAKTMQPSKRGELEITDVVNHYLKNYQLNVKKLSRGMAWLDTGTPESLHDAASFVKVIEERTGQKIGCLEEIAWRKGWISNLELKSLASKYGSSPYGKYLHGLF